MDKHTPGPWRVNTDIAALRIFASDQIATVSPNIVAGRSTTAANAQLIGAAPDLVQALLAVKAQMEGTLDSPTYRVLVAQIDAALAKAGL